MSLELSLEVENMVREKATEEGVSIEELLRRTFASEKSYAPHLLPPKERVQALLALWQAEDHSPMQSPVLARNDETPTRTLFLKWEEEDAHLTVSEREAEALFWEEFQESLNTERERSGMRKLL